MSNELLLLAGAALVCTFIGLLVGLEHNMPEQPERHLGTLVNIRAFHADAKQRKADAEKARIAADEAKDKFHGEIAKLLQNIQEELPL